MGEVEDGRVDEDLLAAAEFAHPPEEAEGIGADDAHGAPVVEAATDERRVHHPVARAPGRDDDDAPGAVAGHIAGVLDFEPELGQPEAVADLDDLLRFLADLGAVGTAFGLDFEVHGVIARDDPCDGDGEAEDVGQAEEQPEAGPHGDERGHREQDDERLAPR